MASVILRFSKQKGNPATKIEAHHERTKEEYKSNPDIDISKSHNNIHLIAPQMRYKAEVDKRIKESGCRVRKDSTRFVDTLITASPEFFKDMTHDKMVEYFQRAVEFMKGKIRPDMIFSAVVHLDEKTPHMHLCFVPLTEDNRLTAKEILGNRVKLSKWQDEFHEFNVNMLSKSLQAEQKDNKALTDAFVEARDKADSRLMELVVLRKQVESLQKLYAKVPEEIRQKIEAKKRNKEVER